jgi:hypothetical protein
MSPSSTPPRARKPWLARADWAARRVHAESGGCLTVGFSLLVVGVSLPMALLLAFMVNLVAGTAASLLAAAALVIATVVMMWRRVRSHGTAWSEVKQTCHLRTLPGVVGGWFKAEVEATLPSPPRAASVALMAQVQGARATRQVWEAAYSLGASQIQASGSGRYRIPVRFKVPRSLKDARDPWFVLYTIFTLADGRSFRGDFRVPVFATNEAPAAEQEDEPPFADPETAGGG